MAKPENLHPSVMVDIENFGTERNDTIVVSIAGIHFNPYRDESIEQVLSDPSRHYEAILDQDQQYEKGMVIEPSCLDWWRDLPAEAQAVLHKEREDVVPALERFAKFLRPCQHIWTNDASFDITRLTVLFKIFDVDWPMPFWKDTCVRTAKFYSGGAKCAVDRLVAHDAFQDSAKQVVQVQTWTRLAVEHIQTMRAEVKAGDEARAEAARLAADTFVGPMPRDPLLHVESQSWGATR